ncbi:hypothetical protein [Streptomyces sp. ISL-86]|uniref:hypothetical protein n=1 Tax=Streptomyces sp. ISL-86 TaxID=2819187 RepID=UPI001BE6DFAF|nr:hypothetical protein [Streptomyces sp. ISL-86]MBT2455497.1 hypothetical protein [Streptomyces sp. ISL-86]
MRASRDVARVDGEAAARAQGRRVLVSRGWAGLALIDSHDDDHPGRRVSGRRPSRPGSAAERSGGRPRA